MDEKLHIRLKSEQELVSEYGEDWREKSPFSTWYKGESTCVFNELGQLCELVVVHVGQGANHYLENNHGCFFIVPALIAPYSPASPLDSISPASKNGNNDGDFILSSRSKLV